MAFEQYTSMKWGRRSLTTALVLKYLEFWMLTLLSSDLFLVFWGREVGGWGGGGGRFWGAFGGGVGLVWAGFGSSIPGSGLWKWVWGVTVVACGYRGGRQGKEVFGYKSEVDMENLLYRRKLILCLVNYFQVINWHLGS